MILNAYLLHAKTRAVPNPLSPGTYDIHRRGIEDFINFEHAPGKKIGALPYRELQVAHVNQGVAHRKQEGRLFGARKKPARWSDTYAHLQLRILRTAFTWAAHEGGLVSESIFDRRGMKTRFPSTDLILKRAAIIDDEHKALVCKAQRRTQGDFAALLKILYHTGARPAEAYMLRADEWRADRQRFEIAPDAPRNIDRLKTRNHLRRQGKTRALVIPDHLVPLVKQRLAKHPEGELFRKEDGKPWNAPTKDKGGRSPQAKLIAARFKSLIDSVNRAAGKTVVRPEVTLNSYRHAFVTRWIKAGNNPMTLCELINTSLDMLRKHYSHLFEEHQALLDAVNKFTTSPENRPRSASA